MIPMMDIYDPEAFAASMRDDAGASLAVASTLYDSVIVDLKLSLTEDIDAIETVYRDASATAIGENALDLAVAKTALDAMMARLSKELESHFSKIVSAIEDIGGAPYKAMAYIRPCLERGSGVQSAIDTIYAPRGQLCEYAAPVDPFGYLPTPPPPPPEAINVPSFNPETCAGLPAAALIDALTCGTAGEVAERIAVEASESVSAMDGESASVPSTMQVGSAEIPEWLRPRLLEYLAQAQGVPSAIDVSGAGPVINKAVEMIFGPKLPDDPLPPKREAPPHDPNRLRGWSSPEKCADRGHEDRAARDPSAEALRIGVAVENTIREFIGEQNRTGSLAGGIMDMLKGAAAWFAERLGKIVEKGTISAIQVSGTEDVRNGGIAALSLGELALQGWLERITAAPFSYMGTGKKYDLQFSAPMVLPQQAEVDELYNRGKIDYAQWECWTKAHGNIPEHRRLLLETEGLKPGVVDEIQLGRLKFQRDEDATARMRELGVKTDRDIAAFRKLAENVPGVSDLIRFMVRDVFDEDAVRDNGYDDEFTQKFLGSDTARAIAEANGVSVETMRREWRAHWNMPSPTQLFEMLHRLRPGKAGLDCNPVSAADVKKALQVDDMAPAWVDRIMATSFAVITRTDLLAWYTNGSIEPEELHSRLMDNGYSDTDATRIIASWAFDVRNRQANRSRTWTRTKIVSQYVKLSLPYSEARRLLLRTVPKASEVDEILADADALRASNNRGKCIAALKKRYMSGAIDDDGAERALRDIVGDMARSRDEVLAWGCELSSRDPKTTLAMLKRWFSRGMETIDSIHERLINMRYTQLQAENIIADMLLSEQEKRDATFRGALNFRIRELKKLDKLSPALLKKYRAELAEEETQAIERLEMAKEMRKVVEASEGVKAAQTIERKKAFRAKAEAAQMEDQTARDAVAAAAQSSMPPESP